MRAIPRILATFLCAIAGVARVQEYRISTVAGGGPPLGPLPALDVSVGNVTGVAATTLYGSAKT